MLSDDSFFGGLASQCLDGVVAFLRNCTGAWILRQRHQRSSWGANRNPVQV